MTAGWRVDDPAKAEAAATTEFSDKADAFILDRENLIALAGPGCYKCEQPYSKKIADQPCAGSVSDVMT